MAERQKKARMVRTYRKQCLSTEENSIIERVKISDNPAKTFFSYLSNKQTIIDIASIIDLALLNLSDIQFSNILDYLRDIQVGEEYNIILPTINSKTGNIYDLKDYCYFENLLNFQNIYDLKDYCYFENLLRYNGHTRNYTNYNCLLHISKFDSKFGRLRDLAVDYIFELCFDYFFIEGYINAYDTSYKILTQSLEMTESCISDSDYEFYNLIKYYKRYLNGPLSEFLQYLSRVSIGGNYKTEFKNDIKWTQPSSRIKQKFKQKIEAKLGYSLEYDSTNIFQCYTNKYGINNCSLNLSYFKIHPWISFKYTPVTFTLNHYSCDFGNNIALEISETFPDHDLFCMTERLFPIQHKDYIKQLHNSIIPLQTWPHPRCIGIPGYPLTHVTKAYIKMVWQSGDTWTCWIPFSRFYGSHWKSITYKFLPV